MADSKSGVVLCGAAEDDITRRVRVYSLPALDVLDWFRFGLSGWPAVVKFPVFDFEHNDGHARVLAVRENFYNRTFEFVVAHPLFDPVPEGHPTPDAVPWHKVEYRVVGIKGGEGG